LIVLNALRRREQRNLAPPAAQLIRQRPALDTRINPLTILREANKPKVERSVAPHGSVEDVDVVRPIEATLLNANYVCHEIVVSLDSTQAP
jgi:hypothetical protein